MATIKRNQRHWHIWLSTTIHQVTTDKTDNPALNQPYRYNPKYCRQGL
ncbi:hypothetical protein ACED29_04320 [Shewanella sp. 5S214]